MERRRRKKGEGGKRCSISARRSQFTRQNFRLGSWEEVCALVQLTLALAVACDNDRSPPGQISY